MFISVSFSGSLYWPACEQETPDAYGPGKWPVSLALAPALTGPWTRFNPTGILFLLSFQLLFLLLLLLLLL